MNVLVIEPDHSIATSITSALTRSGAEVQHAATAQSAIMRADAVTPHIVVLELALPMHNGIEFLYEFRSYAEWSHIPVIVFTTNNVQEPWLLHKLGVVKYLYKPQTNLQALTAHVQNYAFV